MSTDDIPVWQDCGALVTLAFNALCINRFTYLLTHKKPNYESHTLVKKHMQNHTHTKLNQLVLVHLK